jgi:hypothetical protein
MASTHAPARKIVAGNCRPDYAVLETVDCGLVLQGQVGIPPKCGGIAYEEW